MQIVGMEPDLIRGEVANPKTKARAHLEGAEPEALMDTEVDWLLEEEGTAGENASVEEGRDPLVELQEPGVSRLVTPEEVEFLTLLSSSSSSSSPDSEAASTQRSPVVNTWTSATPELDSDDEWEDFRTELEAMEEPVRGADWDPPLHDTPPPDEAAEPPTFHPPEQIRAPTEAGGQLESLPGEQTRRDMGQMRPASARVPEGKTPIGEAHGGRPPDSPDLHPQGSTVWEPESIHSKAHVRAHQARRPVLDEGACMRPDPWPSLGIVNVDPDTCIGSAILLEGEHNQARAASSMLPNWPLNIFHFHIHHLTPSCARIRRERAPPPNGAPSTSALNAGNHPTCRLKT